MRDDWAEILFQSFLRAAIVSCSVIGRDVHSFSLSIQQFLRRPRQWSTHMTCFIKSKRKRSNASSNSLFTSVSETRVWSVLVSEHFLQSAPRHPTSTPLHRPVWIRPETQPAFFNPCTPRGRPPGRNSLKTSGRPAQGVNRKCPYYTHVSERSVYCLSSSHIQTFPKSQVITSTVYTHILSLKVSLLLEYFTPYHVIYMHALPKSHFSPLLKVYM